MQIMVPFAYEQFIGNLTQMVNSGAIPMSRIDDAVTRILRVKFQMGLFESPYADMKLSKALGQEVTFATSTSITPIKLLVLKPSCLIVAVTQGVEQRGSPQVPRAVKERQETSYSPLTATKKCKEDSCGGVSCSQHRLTMWRMDNPLARRLWRHHSRYEIPNPGLFSYSNPGLFSYRC